MKTQEKRMSLDNYLNSAEKIISENNPIYAGCLLTEYGGQCFCTGACQKIISWTPKSKIEWKDLSTILK